MTEELFQNVDRTTAVAAADASLDNSDTARRVFGAQDPYRFVNLRANWRPREQLRISIGVDNLFNQEAYVFHPWPSRTLFLETSLSL